MGKRNPGTGKPDPTKDRSAHEAARGVKTVTLNDLARQLPSDDDLVNYIDHILAESDRGSAIMAAALVERALEDFIRSKLANPEDGTAETWFEGPNAPFRTFSAKISLGRALRVYDETMQERLEIIKNIRNAFAHRSLPLDFSHPTVSAACQKLPPNSERGKDKSARQQFAIACLAIARSLGMLAIAGLHLQAITPGSTDASN